MAESQLVQAIRLEAPKHGVTLFRNSVGLFYDGKGNTIRYGLCVGSSDLIGWDRHGRFVAIECKSPGKKPTPQQLAFLEAVRAAGGIAGVAYSLDDFRRIVSAS